jgi:eukaryotic-like serine/threonine-protein kinase
MATDSERESIEVRLEQVLAKCLHAEEQGTPLDQQQLLAEHPALAEELASFFRNRSAMQQLAEQVLPHQLPTVGSDQFDAEQARQTLGSFGDYELEREIARGGMGVVYRAKQKSLQRTVALKMILAGDHASAEQLARFRQEAEAAARLDHANIVPVYEVGEHDRRRYYTMKLIDGGDLNGQLSRLRQDPKSAVRLVEQVARAVHFAHQHGILHRDLKPANILIDPSGEPHVADFGLARLHDSNAKMTQTGAALGTPGYMAPEQIRGDKMLTTGTDVYSLGAVLYVCLTGAPPFKGANAWEAMQKALDSDPPSPRSANPKTDRDLETICKKALERNPAQRYESAAALADDLSRWLNHEPIAARPVGPIRRSLKWVRRHPVWTALMGMAAAMLLVVAAAYLRERQTNDRAEGFLYRTLITLAEREWSAGAVFNAREALAKCPEKRRGWEWAYVRRLCYATPAHRLGDFPQLFADGGFSADGSRMCAIDIEGMVRVWDAATRREISQVTVAGKGQPKAALSPDGKHLAAANERIVRVFEVDGKTEKWKWEGTSIVDSLAYSPSGRTLAVLGHADNTNRVDTPVQKGVLLLLDAENGRVKLQEPVAEFRYNLSGRMSFSAEGKLLIFDSSQPQSTDGQKSLNMLAFQADRAERLSDVAIANPPDKRSGDDPAAVSPDGQLVAINHPHNNFLEIRRVDGTSVHVDTPTGQLFALTFSNDSKRLAFFTSELNLDLDDIKLNEILPTFGPMLALAAKEQPWLLEAHIVDVATGREVALLRGFNGQGGTLRFSPDGNTLMALGGTQKGHTSGSVAPRGEILVWNVEERATARLLSANAQAIHDLAVSRDGKRLVTAHNDLLVRVWDANSGALLREIAGQDQPVKSLAFGNDPRQILIASGSKAVLWDCETGMQVRTFSADSEGAPWNVGCVAMRPDGTQIAMAIAYGGNKVVLIDTASGKTEFEVEEHAQFLSYSPNGKLLAIPHQFDTHGELKIVDTASGKVRFHFHSEKKMEFFRLGWGYLRATFSPDGRYVAAVGNIGGVHLYDLRSGKLLRKMTGQATTTWDVAFTSDGSRLATSGYSDGTVKLWSVASGEEVHTMRGHTGNVTGLAFSPDDSRLFSADTSGTVRIWEAR